MNQLLSDLWASFVDSVKTLDRLSPDSLVIFIFIMAGKKVWDEVAEHSKEFIQEYLEEFPNV